ncbi:CRISPR-associated protein Cas4 [Texcoconibacillus texcoconensis]|nr:CRISPR-associated protein Cas4 [Texcoconibacillus texcoconensis]
MTYEMPVTGTDIWYYFICKREAWLMMRKIAPDNEDENMEIGRFIHEYTKKRGKKEVDVGHIKVDRLKKIKDEYVVQEIKKSAKFRESARYQLLYYLDTLRQMGIKAKGELTYSEEKKREEVVLTENAKKKLDETIDSIRKLAKQTTPPSPKKIKFCRQCAYKEYCWAEG